MYLADDHFRRSGVRDEVEVVFASAGGDLRVPRYARTLEQVVARKGIETLFQHNLIEVRPEARRGRLPTHRDGRGGGDPLRHDPRDAADERPDFIKRSPLADAAGWVDVDKDTLRHARYPNVFGLGDASNLPTSKTGAAIRKQAPGGGREPDLGHAGRAAAARYDGYTSCPLVTGYGKLVLAEFDYDKNPQETFPLDQSQGAPEHVPAEEVRAAAHVLARHAAGPGLAGPDAGRRTTPRRAAGGDGDGNRDRSRRHTGGERSCPSTRPRSSGSGSRPTSRSRRTTGTTTGPSTPASRCGPRPRPPTRATSGASIPRRRSSPASPAATC